MIDRHVENITSRVGVAGRDAIDVGCGVGVLVRRLAALGARVIGIEVGADALARARGAPRVADERYHAGPGENLPLEDASADLVVYLFSLHHVPVGRQLDAIAEARRVLRPGGRLHVIEPLAEGPYFNLLRRVDDETAIRAEAQRALARAETLGFRERDRTSYPHVEQFEHFEEFRDRAILVDAERARTFPLVEAQTRDAFAANGRRVGGRFVFEQPCIVAHLERV